MFKILSIILKNLKNLNFLFFILFSPLYLIIIFFVIIVKPLVTIRFAVLRSDRIGHFAIETELYLLRKKLRKKNNKIIDIMTCSYEVSNSFLKKKLSEHIVIVPRFLMLPVILFFKKIKKDTHLIPREEFFPKDISNLLDDNDCNLKFSEAEKMNGDKILKKLGIYEDTKFVCINSRDEEYFKNEKRINLSYHSYRNVDIELFKDTAEYLNKKGIKVIRLGKKVEKKISYENNNIFDYASSNLRSDFMDLYLVSKSYFYIGAGGGLDVLPMLLRRPKLTTNLVPIIGITAESKNVMSIFKHHFSIKLNRNLSIKEIVKNNLDSCFHSNEFKEKNIKLINNSSNEIMNATDDMLKNINKKLILNDNEKKYQEKFWSIFPLKKLDKKGMPLHGRVRGLISPSFLEKNKYLLN